MFFLGYFMCLFCYEKTTRVSGGKRGGVKMLEKASVPDGQGWKQGVA